MDSVWQFFSCLILRPFQIVSVYLPHVIVSPVVRVLPYVCLGAICYMCDAFLISVRHRVFPSCVLDNAFHGIIAFVSWCIVSNLQTRKDLTDGISCGIIACGLDIDHFIAAKSFRLQDALQLSSRPFLHATTIVFIIVPVLQVWFAQNISCLRPLPYLFTVAVISHHLRDGNRHGLWFWPLGSTPPLPYWMYISFTILLPLLVKEVKHFVDRLPAIPISRKDVPLLDV